MPEQPPGTLRNRVDASMILYSRGVQWLYANPDESLAGFTSWLESQEWRDGREDWTEVLQYDAEHVGRLIWQMFEVLR